MTKRLIFDLETNGLLPRVNRIHTLSIADADSEARWTFRKHDHVKGERFDGTPYEFEPRDDLAEGLEMLAEADLLIGHNIIKYDIPVIRHIYRKWKTKAVLRDTLTLAQLIMPDTSRIDAPLVRAGKMPGVLYKKHKLEAWGYRLGVMKGDYAEICAKLGRDPWAEWNPDMEEYGDQDVTVTKMLWDNCVIDMPELMAVEMEHEITELAAKIQRTGYPFDHAAALTLRDEVADTQAEKMAVVKERYGYWYAPDKKRLVRPVYDDPDADQRPTPFHKAKARAELKAAKAKRAAAEAGEAEPEAEEFDISDFDPKTGYLKIRPEFGEDDSRSIWAEVTVPKKPRKVRMKIDGVNEHYCVFSPDLPYCKIKRIDFNPGSRLQIADRLVQMHNWSPVDFTETGQPEINDEVLTKVAEDGVPEAADFADLFFTLKLLGQIETGKNSWLNSYDPDTGCIHGSINTGGTVSGRCSHSNPNLGQVPGILDTEPVNKDGTFNPKCVDEEGDLHWWCYDDKGQIKKKVYLPGRVGNYGIECRALFYTPQIINGEAWKQVGVDLVNIEARALAAQLAPFDDGELIRELTINGVDLHTFNQRKTGIKNRGVMKRVFFGLLYGAGDLKLGATAEPYLSEKQQRALGKELRELIMASIPALKKAWERVQNEARTGFLIGLDGRKLHVRSLHSSFNTRLQSDAALIAKKWTLLAEERLIDAGGIHGWEGDFAMMAFVHDEIQFGVKAFFAEQAAEIVKAAATEAGEFFDFLCPVAADAKIGHNWSETH